MITHNWWRSFHGSPVPGPREGPPQAHQSHQFRPACSPWRRKRHPGWVSLNGLKHREMVWIWGNILNQKPWFLPMKYGGFLQISFKPIHWIKKCETHHVDNGWVCPKTRLFSQPFADCSMRLVLSIVINLLSLVFCVQSSFQQQNEKRRPSERRVILQSRQPERSQAVDAEATDQPWLGHCNGFVSPFIWSLGFLLFFFQRPQANASEWLHIWSHKSWTK